MTVGDHLFDILTLRKLNFSSNKIVQVSAEISRLTNLTSANFSNNEIVNMCNEIGSISSLVELNLIENPLVTPNRATARTSAENVASYMKRQWTALATRSLELIHMGIPVLTDDVLLMTSLQSLNLSQNVIKIFPISNFHDLITLNLSENKFTEAPKSIGVLQSLRTLIMSGCHCSHLPASYKNCKMLESLQFSRNNLADISDNFFMEFNYLTELDVSFNRNLVHISHGMSILTRLLILDVSGTAINTFTMKDAIHTLLQTLKLLWMPNLKLNEIHCDFNIMTALQVLGIGGKCMREPLCDNFSSLTNLEDFSVSGHIPCLPYSIASSPKLRLISTTDCTHMMSPCNTIITAGAPTIIKYLQIMWNSHFNKGSLDLSAMQIDSSIANVTYMQHLVHANLADNLLTSCNFLGPLLTNLQTLNLSRNHLSVVSDTVSFLTALKTLLLDSNLLQSLPETMGNCNAMIYISLLHNPISSIPISLARCKSLHRVYVDTRPDQEIENFPLELQGNGSEFLQSYLSAHAQVYTNHVEEVSFKPEQYEFDSPAIGLTHIPASVLMLSKLQRMNLSLNSILRLPEQLFRLYDLVELNLNFCELSIVPNMINNLTNITNLCLAGNRLTSFDVNMTPMSSIKKLWLQDNRLTKVTKTLERCLELRCVILRNNLLKIVPLKIWKFRFLAELGLGGNPELEVPPAELVDSLTVVESCAFLKAFDEAADVGIFDGAGLHLHFFPLGTIRIASLTNLSIRNNHIQYIPDEISCIKNLKYFDMRQNPCRRLTPTLCTLGLTQLLCDQDTFTCPPPLIISQGLQKINWFLRKLFAARITGKVIVKDEKLSVFEFFTPDFDCIKIFDVKAARLQEVPTGIRLCTSLTDLQLNDNHISLLTDEFCECSSLRRASFANNRISQNVNKKVSNLHLLAEIDVSGNFLHIIPEALFGIPNIMTINISNNNISGFKVPKNAWLSLTHLDLSHNMLSELPLSLFEIVSIKVLLVAYNSILSLQQHFDFLQNLTKLDVSSNMLESLEELRKLDHLQSLYASKNKIKCISHHFGGLKDLQELQFDENPLEFPPIEVSSTGSQNTLALMRQYFEGFTNGSLDIQSFGLRSLSTQLLSMEHLLVLNARNNSIFVIPQEIGNLTNLQELYLDKNRIGSIPTEVSIPFALIMKFSLTTTR